MVLHWNQSMFLYKKKFLQIVYDAFGKVLRKPGVQTIAEYILRKRSNLTADGL